jgi:hypothetical protein
MSVGAIGMRARRFFRRSKYDIEGSAMLLPGQTCNASMKAHSQLLRTLTLILCEVETRTVKELQTSEKAFPNEGT